MSIQVFLVLCLLIFTANMLAISPERHEQDPYTMKAVEIATT